MARRPTATARCFHVDCNRRYTRHRGLRTLFIADSRSGRLPWPLGRTPVPTERVGRLDVSAAPYDIANRFPKGDPCRSSG